MESSKFDQKKKRVGGVSRTEIEEACPPLRSKGASGLLLGSRERERESGGVGIGSAWGSRLEGLQAVHG